MHTLLIASIATALKPAFEWAAIQAGTFTMGRPASDHYSDDDETRFQVSLSAFKMSRYEVTFE